MRRSGREIRRARLLLGRLLELSGVESVIIEQRSREYVENRMRAGMLEHRTVQLLAELGLDERLRREGAVHEGFELRHRGRRHRIPMTELTDGCTAVMYGQQEIVRDAVALRIATGQPLHFEAGDVRIAGIDSDRPRITYNQGDETHVLDCDVVVGCDGGHGTWRAGRTTASGPSCRPVSPSTTTGR